MAKEKNPKVDLAYELYKKGYKLIDIAKELDIPDGTVRRWKSTYKWDGERSLKNSERSVKKENTQNRNNTKKQNKEKPIADEVKEVMENGELNDKQRLFCVIYAKCFNATKAYQKVYKCTYESAMVAGPRMLGNVRVKEQIDELTKIRFNKEALKNGVLQKYIDIAFADLGDYLSFGKEQVLQWTKDKYGTDRPVIDPNTGEQKIKEYNYVDLKESIAVDTSLISEVAEGKDGIKFKLADKMKALEFLNKHLNLLSDEDKTKLDIENKKLQNSKLETEIDRLKGNKDTNTDTIQIVDDIDE